MPSSALAPLYSGYSDLRDVEVTVGNQGIGAFYDYDVAEGMYYIEEDSAPMVSEQGVNKVITDTQGRAWEYDETRVETEYVWRNYENDGKMHVADGYSGVPEVLGDYTTEAPYQLEDEEGNPVVDEEGNPVMTTDARNGFLEFYVYNVYKSREYPAYIKKVDIGSPQAEEGLINAEFDLYGPYTQGETESLNFNPKQPAKKVNENPIVTRADQVKIGDLKNGIYYLCETKAPVGYDINKNPIKIIVDSSKESTGQVITYEQEGSSIDSAHDQSGCIYVNYADDGQTPLDDPYYRLLITNSPGYILPMTGGPGTWIYRVIGLMLVAGAGCTFLLRNRKAARR